MEDNNPDSRPVTSVRTMEIVMALLFIAVGVIVMMDSVRVGNGWAPDGPEAGYFPFYIGLIMLISSLVTLATAVLGRSGASSVFMERGQFKLVLKVLVPTIVFVILVGMLGIYVSAALFIAFFMGWVGRYGIARILPVALLVPIALFFMFEVWFLVPLPKGPIEALLGY